MNKRDIYQHNNKIVRKDTSHLKRYKMTVDLVMSFNGEAEFEAQEDFMARTIDSEFGDMHEKLLFGLRKHKINMHTATFQVKDEKGDNVITRLRADGNGYL